MPIGATRMTSKEMIISNASINTMSRFNEVGWRLVSKTVTTSTNFVEETEHSVAIFAFHLSRHSGFELSVMFIPIIGITRTHEIFYGFNNSLYLYSLNPRQCCNINV